MTDMQGEVWWGPAPHKSDSAYRPWLVVSDISHPFSQEECIVVAMTTRSHVAGIPIPDEGWVAGGSETDAYISPWYVMTVKHRDLDNQQGVLADSLVIEAIEALHGYTSLS